MKKNPSQALRLAVLVALLAAPAAAHAQLVTPKTVPVHQAAQFQIYPSARPGLGGASLAVDDTLADPFVNPAKGARVRESGVFVLPYAHAVSGGRGGGRTLPFGGYVVAGDWSVSGVAALQQLDRAGPVWNRPTSQRTATNRYGSLSMARRLDPSTAVGVSLFGAELGAIDGVDLLYSGSDRIEQSGSLLDVRLGLTRDDSRGRALELLLLHSRTAMVHDVNFPELFGGWWEPGMTQPDQRPIQDARHEINEDRTNIWGAHAGYTLPVGSQGWRLGVAGTANRLAHPKIPNYVIQNIPRDPGTTWAWNGGMGLSRTMGDVRVAFDAVYEPIWSETWADAAWDTVTASGRRIAAGGKTVENSFRFSNVKLRGGVGSERTRARDGDVTFGYQVGLSVHAIDYTLDQTNNVLESFRTQREHWVEWTPSFALRYRSRDIELGYGISLSCGTGRCFPSFSFEDTGVVAPPSSGGIIAAPASPLFFDSGSAVVHRFTLVLPIR